MNLSLGVPIMWLCLLSPCCLLLVSSQGQAAHLYSFLAAFDPRKFLPSIISISAWTKLNVLRLSKHLHVMMCLCPSACSLCKEFPDSVTRLGRCLRRTPETTVQRPLSSSGQGQPPEKMDMGPTALESGFRLDSCTINIFFLGSLNLFLIF